MLTTVAMGNHQKKPTTKKRIAFLVLLFHTRALGRVYLVFNDPILTDFLLPWKYVLLRCIFSIFWILLHK